MACASRLLCVGLAFVLLGGCNGPLLVPMVKRLDAPQQARIDKGWNELAAPRNATPRQELLDAIVVFQLFQSGVDSMSFRSEKRTATGLVVMDIHFERDRPENDRFVLTIRDDESGEVRREAYQREEIEQTIRELFPHELSDRMENGPPLTPREEAELKQLEKRWERLKELFPDVQEQPVQAAIEQWPPPETFHGGTG